MDAKRSLHAALADLDRLIATRPELADAGRKLGPMLRAAFAEPGRGSPAVDADSEHGRSLLAGVVEGWNQGVPAARVLELSLDAETFRPRLLAIDACTNSPREGVGLRASLESDPGRSVAWALTLLTEGVERLGSVLGDAGLDQVYTSSVVRLALLGELGDWSVGLLNAFVDAPWPHGDCPICGVAPTLAEARGLEQRRFLRCGWCAAGWPAARGTCPSCGESDARSLRHLTAEEDHDRYRLSICEACGGRLKIVNTLTPLSPPGLVVADLATVHLDFLEAHE